MALAKLYCFCLLIGMEGVNLVYDVVYYFCLLIGTEGVNVVYGVVYYFCLLTGTKGVKCCSWHGSSVLGCEDKSQSKPMELKGLINAFTSCCLCLQQDKHQWPVLEMEVDKDMVSNKWECL